MTPKKIWVATVLLWTIALALVAMGALFLYVHKEQLFEEDIGTTVIPPHTPRNSFTQKQSLQEVLQSPSFLLASTDRQMRLPDLRGHILFYGCNERPDKLFAPARVQFGIRGTQAVYPGRANENLYLRYDSRANRWLVSDSPTPLTIMFSPKETVSDITVELKNDKDEIVKTPNEFHFFWVPTTPLPPGSASTEKWELGTLPVDPSLFERQGAVWWGQDEVVKTFGKDEMAYQACRERVQFTSDDTSYVVWMKENDCFLFENDQWISVEPGPESIGKPLLLVKAVEPKAIHLELWNGDGSHHAVFSIPRRETSTQTATPLIRLLGAKSRKQWIAEIQKKKTTLSPDDWVIVNGDEIIRINNEDILDDYLSGKISGNLLVFRGFEKIDGESSLVGTFFDSTRTQQQPFAISLYRSWSSGTASPSKDMDTDEEADEEEFNDEDFLENEDENGEFEDEDDVETEK